MECWPHSPKNPALAIAGVVIAVVVGSTVGADAVAADGGGEGAFVDVERVVDVAPAELDRWLSQGRHAKAITPSNRMIAATPPRTTRALRDPVAGSAGDLSVEAGADLRGFGAA